jgi:hypothetical protein
VGYVVKATIGAALFLGCLVLFNVKLVSVLETGTCASGNVPYDIAPGYQCPDHTGRDILLLTASIFGMLIGAGIFALRGDSPWGGRSRSAGRFGAGILAWGLFFTATGATALISSLTDEAIKNSNGGQAGGIIVGAVFIVMGLPALLFSLWGLLTTLGGRDERPAMAGSGASGLGALSQSSGFGGARHTWGRFPTRGAGGSSSSAQIAKLERLQKLRESGALTDAEFEREKAKVLAE